jgi:propanediol dehydratase large subunit
MRSRRSLAAVTALGRPERHHAKLVYDEVMKARIYVDASVVGGCEDEEFSEYSVQLMERFVRGELVLVVSALTVQELAGAPDKVRRRLASVPEAHIETLQLDAEARELAEAYIAEGVITAKMRADAQHIAIATVGRVDVLVSWNFKHIVNLHRIHGYNSVNLRRGYPTLEIRAPREVLPDD